MLAKKMESYFELHETRHGFRMEMGAGLATFLTAAYIIIVNPNILATTGMDKGALVTITCLSTGLATLLMGLWGRAPLMLAPGMGLNAFFAFGVCKSAGVAWPVALGIVFLSGGLGFLLATVGVREKLVNSIPRGLRVSMAVGIGLFISFIGLQQLGLVQRSEATMVTLGHPTWETALGLIGFLGMAAMEIKKVRGSILIGILGTTLLGAIVGKVTLPTSILSLPHSMAPVALKLDILGALHWSLLPLILAFMYVDVFDSLGTFMAVSRRAGMIRSDGTITRLGRLLRIDCLASMGGAVLGTSTITTYIESAVGIAHGGRTGITAVTTACLFFLAMFFAPLVLAVPAFATAPALILVGLHMVRDIQEVDFSDWGEAVPAFITVLLMPLTYSIANGIMFGFLTHSALKIFVGKIREISLAEAVITGFSVLNLVLVLLKDAAS